MVDYSKITELRLAGMGITPYSARGLSQTLKPIAGSAQLRRTINGALSDVGDPLFRKYESVINGSDMDPPSSDGVWPGAVLVVDCVVELSYPTPTEAATDDAGREAVPGSEREADGFTFYRPRLTMLVRDFNVNRDEWGAVTDWTLSLEEV